MTTHTIRHIPAPGIARLAALLHGAAHRAFGIARALDRWIGEGRRARADRLVLAAMSDRELADIGVPRASIDAVADLRWRRDRAG
ncbi:MAG: DUF1127 domain-containing protein [Burkholderiales bacterium]